MSKLKLIGENHENGYGIILEQGKVITLLKQPFDLDNRFILDEKELDKAYSHGFNKVDRGFDNFSELEKYLNGLVKGFKDQHGIEDKPFTQDRLADYYRTLPISAIETTIELLEEDSKNYRFISFACEALRENPRFDQIKSSYKSALTKLIKSVQDHEKSILEPFKNLDKREYHKRKDYSPLYKMAS